MRQYKLLNNIVGWSVFAVALVTYTLTVEQTASFWDCGEFIAASYKLQIPHPPGAPLFLLIGRMFSLLASDVTQVAFWVNMVSVLSSAFTIAFLFWTITLLVRKMLRLKSSDEVSPIQGFSILASGALGALAYTFSDSFWFSAVEAEVYAMSSLFTAFVFWAMLRWDAAEGPDADRWLLLIFYAMGLSIGVHLLNLVTVPALAMIYYFKKYTFSWTGIGIAMAASLGILFGIQEFTIIMLPSLAGKAEIFFVNALGLPFGSGIIFFIALFLGGVVYALYYSTMKNMQLLNTALICYVFVLLGYSTYAMIPIRSQFNPPIDENNPENIISIVSYLKREQYGDRPLMFGPIYTTKQTGTEKGEPKYRKGDKKYVQYDFKYKPTYDKGKMLFPRVYSKQPEHIRQYEKIMGLNKGEKPSFVDNLKFFFIHQLGHMYGRYLLWNFVGREGDVQDDGVLLFQSDKDVPDIIKDNKARNRYFAIPLILALLGMIYHAYKDEKNFWVVMTFFILTGVALIVYLNQPPTEPRERDYIHAGSFYVFCIWLGIGLFGLWDFLDRFIKNKWAGVGLATALSMSAPVLMAKEGWDDHNRSNRWHSIDSAKNLLNSCAKNAILFTGGDNDTFPLWYAQEVEGVRTDVRVCNLSLLNTDWYIAQMKTQAYESAPLPISFESEQFADGTNDYLVYIEGSKLNEMQLPIDFFLNMVKSNHQMIKHPMYENMNGVPSLNLTLAVDTNVVKAKGLAPAPGVGKLSPMLSIRLPKKDLEKAEMIVLDIIANNKDWSRPIYFASTMGQKSYLGFTGHFRQEGLAYRLMPYANTTGGPVVNTQIMYDNMMNQFAYRGLNEDAYFDENYRRFPANLRSSFYQLAVALFEEGKKEECKQVLLKCIDAIPDQSLYFDQYSSRFVGLLYRVGEKERAAQMGELIFDRAVKVVNYYTQKDNVNAYIYEIMGQVGSMQEIAEAEKAFGDAKKAESYQAKFEATMMAMPPAVRDYMYGTAE